MTREEAIKEIKTWHFFDNDEKKVSKKVSQRMISAKAKESLYDKIT